MNAVNKLICNKLGDQNYQYALNVQTWGAALYPTVANEHIQLLHDG